MQTPIEGVPNFSGNVGNWAFQCWEALSRQADSDPDSAREYRRLGAYVCIAKVVSSGLPFSSRGGSDLQRLHWERAWELALKDPIQGINELSYVATHYPNAYARWASRFEASGFSRDLGELGGIGFFRQMDALAIQDPNLRKTLEALDKHPSTRLIRASNPWRDSGMLLGGVTTECDRDDSIEVEEIRAMNRPSLSSWVEEPASNTSRLEAAWIRVIVIVDPNGIPMQARGDFEDADLRAAAEQHALQWRFEAMRLGGNPQWAQSALWVHLRRENGVERHVPSGQKKVRLLVDNSFMELLPPFIDLLLGPGWDAAPPRTQ